MIILENNNNIIFYCSPPKQYFLGFFSLFSRSDYPLDDRIIKYNIRAEETLFFKNIFEQEETKSSNLMKIKILNKMFSVLSQQGITRHVLSLAAGWPLPMLASPEHRGTCVISTGRRTPEPEEKQPAKKGALLAFTTFAEVATFHL